nr:hypothetical protein [Schlegelella koreensis]
MEDRVLEHGVEALPNSLQGLGYALAGVCKGTNGGEPRQERGSLNRGYRCVPERLRNMVLERGDPLRSVLRGARRLDHSLVIPASCPCKGQVLPLLLCLRFLDRAPGGLAPAVALVNGVDALPQELARGMRLASGGGEALAGLLGAAAVRGAESHLGPATACSRESEHPRRGRIAHSKQQSTAVREVAVTGREHLARG